MRFLVLLALVASAAPAFADSSSDAFFKSGLAGTWAEDCSKPAQEGNWYDIYALAKSGHVTETLSNQSGKTYRVSALRDFRNFTPTRVAYVMDDDNEILDLVIEIKGKRHHTWSSVARGGKAYILDGKLVDGGNETTWFNKCEK